MCKKIDPIKVANYFLYRANGRLTPLQVQKLVYYAHGWSLAIFCTGLINERIEVWPYGPVVKSVYYKFKKHGANFIGHNGKNDHTDFSSDQCALLDQVWKAYGHYTGIELSKLTHKPDSPWDIAYRNHQSFIKDDLINDYFQNLIKRRSEIGQ